MNTAPKAISLDLDDTLWPIWKRNLAICWLGGFITNAGMTMVLPFIPLYLEQLGLHREADVEQWAGVAFGASRATPACVTNCCSGGHNRRSMRRVSQTANNSPVDVRTCHSSRSGPGW